MKEERLIHEKVEAIFEKMAGPVFWQERRDGGPDRELSGYLTKAPGAAAAWEIRFRHGVPGLRAGAVLKTPATGGRWLVVDLVEERLAGDTLYLSARVSPLEDAAPAPAEDDLHLLLQGLRTLLGLSALAPLERDDVAEALDRLAVLGPRASEAGHAQRIKARLALLRDRFQACPQTAHESRGLLLRLEAYLRRKGLP